MGSFHQHVSKLPKNLKEYAFFSISGTVSFREELYARANKENIPPENADIEKSLPFKKRKKNEVQMLCDFWWTGKPN